MHMCMCYYSHIKDKRFKFYSRGYNHVKGLGMRETYFIEELEEGQDPALEYLPGAIRVLEEEASEEVSSPEKKEETVQPVDKESASDKPTPSSSEVKPANEGTPKQELTDTSKEQAISPDQRPKPVGTSPEHSTSADPKPTRSVPDGTSVEHEPIVVSTTEIEKESPENSPEPTAVAAPANPVSVISPSSITSSPERTSQTQPPHVETQPPHVETQPPHVETQPPHVETQPPHVETQPPHVETQPPHMKTQPPQGTINLQVSDHPDTLKLSNPEDVATSSITPTTSGRNSPILAPEDIPTPDALRPCRVKLPPLNKPHSNPTFPADQQDEYTNPLGGSMLKPPQPGWIKKAAPKVEEERGENEESAAEASPSPMAAAASPQETSPKPPKDYFVEVKIRRCALS